MKESGNLTLCRVFDRVIQQIYKQADQGIAIASDCHIIFNLAF